MLVDPPVWLSLVLELATAGKVDIGTLATSDYFQGNDRIRVLHISKALVLGALSRSSDHPLNQTRILNSEKETASGFGPLCSDSIFSQPWRHG